MRMMRGAMIQSGLYGCSSVSAGRYECVVLTGSVTLLWSRTVSVHQVISLLQKN